MGWRREAARALAVLVGVAGTGLPAGATEHGTRQVVGVLAVQGEVWTQEVGGSGGEARVPGTEGALLERTRLRTGKEGAALLTLSQDGLVGLRAGTTAEVAARGADGPRIQLVAGEALVRLPAGSRLTLVTATATVRAEGIQPVAVGAVRPNEVSVHVLPDGQTVVRVQSGGVQVESRDGGTSLVRAGEQATLAADGAPRIVAASTAPGALAPAAGAAAGGAGLFSSDAAIAGLAAIGVAAGTLGGLGAAGKLGNASSSDTSADTGQGSPFRPHHGHGNGGNGGGNGGNGGKGGGNGKH